MTEQPSPWARPKPQPEPVDAAPESRPGQGWTYPPDPPLDPDATRVLPSSQPTEVLSRADVESTQVLPSTPVPEPTQVLPSTPVPEPTRVMPVQDEWQPRPEPAPQWAPQPQPQRQWQHQQQGAPQTAQPQWQPSAPPPPQAWGQQPQQPWQAQQQWQVPANQWGVQPYPQAQQWSMQPPAQPIYLSGPPPQRSMVATIFGWLMIAWASLMTLGMLSSISEGNMSLVSDDFAYTLGTWIAIAGFIVLPMWWGIWLVRRYQKNLAKWRQREAAAAQWARQQQQQQWGQQPPQQYQQPWR